MSSNMNENLLRNRIRGTARTTHGEGVLWREGGWAEWGAVEEGSPGEGVRPQVWGLGGGVTW